VYTELDFSIIAVLKKDPHTAGQYHSYDPYEHNMGRTARGCFGSRATQWKKGNAWRNI
jgi:hypothetical protein